VPASSRIRSNAVDRVVQTGAVLGAKAPAETPRVTRGQRELAPVGARVSAVVM